MTFEEAIKEAIKHEEKVVSDYERLKKVRALDEFEVYCLEYHRQLAEWLKDYKKLLMAIDAIKSEIAEYLQAEGFGSEYRNDITQIIDRRISGKEQE